MQPSFLLPTVGSIEPGYLQICIQVIYLLRQIYYDRRCNACQYNDSRCRSEENTT